MTLITLQGIPNCDTVKKAKRWLAQHNIAYTFRDYKKQPPSLEELTQWAQQVGWENLLNKRGSTWRKLEPAQQQGIDESKAIILMQANPSMIKRPLLRQGTHALVGFNADSYQTFIQKPGHN